MLKRQKGQRLRPLQINVRLDEEEYDQLDKLCKITGRGKSNLIRELLSGYKPKESPPQAFYNSINYIRKLLAELNQIKFFMYRSGEIEVSAVKETLDKIIDFINEIEDTYLTKEKFDNTKI